MIKIKRNGKAITSKTPIPNAKQYPPHPLFLLYITLSPFVFYIISLFGKVKRVSKTKRKPVQKCTGFQTLD